MKTNILICSILILLCSCVKDNTPLNFSTVDYTIYRGGQPTKAGWDYIKSLGVVNVIKLNTQKDASDRYAEQIGMTVQYYPIPLVEQMTEVSSNKVWNAVSFIQSNTYIHCAHGEDRTGLIVACYRLKNGEDKESAEKEMLLHGFHKSLIGLWKFWEEQHGK